MAGHGGGAWKVAYADFVTAMMAFFLVMWIMAQSKQVKVAVAKYFSDPSATATKPGGSESMLPSDEPAEPREPAAARGVGMSGAGASLTGAKTTPPERAKDPLKKTQRLSVLHDGNDRVVGATLAFAEPSAELNEDAQQQLNALVLSLRGKRNKIELRAHATRRPLPPESPYRDAWQLCYARCQSTMKFLEHAGVESDRFRLSQVGPFEPYTIRVGNQSQTLNSRVEVYVLADLVDDFVGTPAERNERVKRP